MECGSESRERPHLISYATLHGLSVFGLRSDKLPHQFNHCQIRAISAGMAEGLQGVKLTPLSAFGQSSSTASAAIEA